MVRGGTGAADVRAGRWPGYLTAVAPRPPTQPPRRRRRLRSPSGLPPSAPTQLPSLASTQPCPTSFDIGLSLNSCPRKLGAPQQNHAVSFCIQDHSELPHPSTTTVGRAKLRPNHPQSVYRQLSTARAPSAGRNAMMKLGFTRTAPACASGRPVRRARATRPPGPAPAARARTASRTTWSANAIGSAGNSRTAMHHTESDRRAGRAAARTTRPARARQRPVARGALFRCDLLIFVRFEKGVEHLYPELSWIAVFVSGQLRGHERALDIQGQHNRGAVTEALGRPRRCGGRSAPLTRDPTSRSPCRRSPA